MKAIDREHFTIARTDQAGVGQTTTVDWYTTSSAYEDYRPHYSAYNSQTSWKRKNYNYPPQQFSGPTPGFKPQMRLPENAADMAFIKQILKDRDVEELILPGTNEFLDEKKAEAEIKWEDSQKRDKYRNIRTMTTEIF